MESMDVDLRFEDLVHRIRVLETMLLNLLHDYYELKHARRWQMIT
jgi:hypothetical protein